MSRGRYGRIRRRRGQYATVNAYLAGQCRPRPKPFRDDSTVSDFLRGEAMLRTKK